MTARESNAVSVEYQEHLQSDYWQAVRNIALQVVGCTCVLCGSSERLEVHHRGYENLGQETLADVTVLCRDCHERHHHGGGPVREVTVLVFDGPDTMSDQDRAVADRIGKDVFGS